VLLLELEQAKHEKRTKAVVTLASRAGSLERTIAAALLESGRVSEAVINLISAASCFIDARRHVEAKRAYTEAMQLSDRIAIHRMVRESGVLDKQTATPGRVFRTSSFAVKGNPLLRRPQVEAYDAAQSHFQLSNEHAIVQLPVGCGKTGTMSVLPFGVADGRTLVVAPNLEIAQNLRRSFDYSQSGSFLRKTKVLTNGHGPACAILDSNAAIFDCDDSDYVVCNVQQLVAADRDKWLAQFSSDYFDMVLFDEGHHKAAESWKAIEQAFPRAKFASFTATPLRADGKKIEGKLIYRFPIGDAIKEGYIKNIAARRLEPVEIHFEYKGSSKKYSLSEVLKLREEAWFSKGVALAPECNRNIVNAAIQCMQELRAGSSVKHQIIAAACSIDHAKAICSLFRERGLTAEVLHSKMKEDDQARVRLSLERQELDVVVHVQMLGEGADYPTLSVAAIFRPFRHIVPYVQFVGRIMRVVRQDSPGHPDNRGFVVSHAGLHVDRWWEELRLLDKDDQSFFEGLGNLSKPFVDLQRDANDEARRRFAPSMQVLDETIEYFIQEHFLDLDDANVMVADLIRALELRGFDLDTLGVSADTLAERLVTRGEHAKGRLEPAPVQPQRARQEAKRRLDERVRSGAKQLLNELGLSPGGRRLVGFYPQLGAATDLPTAIILLNGEVNRYLNIGNSERALLTETQLRDAHDHIDEVIDELAKAVRMKIAATKG